MTTIHQKIIYLNYFDSILETKVKPLMAIISDLMQRENPDMLYFLFSSSGGNVDPAIALYNFLRALPVEIVMHNTGNIDSIGNIVFLAADTRYASVHSSFLLHGISWPFQANVFLNKAQLTEILSNLNSSESKIFGIITERTKLTTQDLIALFAQGETKDATFALTKELVQEIKNPEIPKGVNVLSFNLP